MLLEIKKDKEKLRNEIKRLMNDFETKYEQDIIRGIKIIRWNGSNNAFGKISDINISVII